jgi:hypothetical protein
MSGWGESQQGDVVDFEIGTDSDDNVSGVLKMTDVQSRLDGDQASGLGVFVGEPQRLANRARSVGIAEMVLRSPIVVSSVTALSSIPRVILVSSLAGVLHCA